MSETNTSGAQVPCISLLADALSAVLKLLDDGVLVRNTDNDHDVMAFMRQSMRITQILKAAQDALESANG